jgi:hypothetical protein
MTSTLGIVDEGCTLLTAHELAKGAAVPDSNKLATLSQLANIQFLTRFVGHFDSSDNRKRSLLFCFFLPFRRPPVQPHTYHDS